MHVAVIIPVRDMSDLVEGAVNSVLHQTHDDFSVWVVDDGSQDGTAEVVSRYIEMGIHPLGAGGVGPAKARNLAVEGAFSGVRPDAFAFLDADDRYDPRMLRLAVDRLEEQPYVDLVYADESYEDRLAGVAFARHRPPFTPQAVIAGQAAGGSYVLRARFVEKHGPFDESFRVGEMHEMASRVAAVSSCSHIPKALVKVNLDYRALRHAVPEAEWAAAYKTVMRRAGAP